MDKFIRRVLRTGFLLILLLLSISSTVAVTAGQASKNLIVNGGFEQVQDNQPLGWNRLWTREPSAGELDCSRKITHGGEHSVRIEHRGRKDWSLNHSQTIDVTPGDVYELAGWINTTRKGCATICVIAYDKNKKVLDWAYGGRQVKEAGKWNRLKARFVIPEGVQTILPRLIGDGPATVWVDDVSLIKKGNVSRIRNRTLPPSVSAGNKLLSLLVDTNNAAFSVTDKRTGHTWKQQPLTAAVVLQDVNVSENIELTWLHAGSGNEYKTVIELEENKPEFVMTTYSESELEDSLMFPHPFTSQSGSYLVVPMNEGISYPVEDKSIQPRKLIAYGGHGICMPFWGVTDGKTGHMAIIETPDDASIRIERLNGNLCIAPEWDSQKGVFGYPRRLRFVFFEDGGHVAICKRYRSYAQNTGLLKTLKQKLQANPNVDLLIGAVNVWCWESNAADIARQMQSLGIKRLLWSHRGSPETVAEMNKMEGVLTSRYDIYQDLMEPEVVKNHLWGLHPDWTQAGWPDDLMLDEYGNRRSGWQVRGKDKKMYPCGVLCDKQALKHASARVPNELKNHQYRCRFIDTTTASPWRQCYHIDHPMTRSESRYWKMELLRFMSEEMKLVTGSETGHDAAVPYVHYFEGMLSLGPYRVPDAGRDMIKPITDVPERVAKFQVGHKYRLPLWELVYHDCVVAQWYWGDYNNKLPALWDKRDLFNILYGTPPMFMFNEQIWKDNKERFVQSYKNICPVVRAVGYYEMIDHSFLTPDRSVQRTIFDNGIKIIVNFGAEPHKFSDGKILPAGDFLVVGDLK